MSTSREAALAAASGAEQAEGAEDYERLSHQHRGHGRPGGFPGVGPRTGSAIRCDHEHPAVTRVECPRRWTMPTGGADQSAAPRFVDPFEARKRGRAAGSSRPARRQPVRPAPAGGFHSGRIRGSAEEPSGSGCSGGCAPGPGRGRVLVDAAAGRDGACTAAAAAVNAPGPGTPEGQPRPDGDADARSIEAAILDGRHSAHRNKGAMTGGTPRLGRRGTGSVSAGSRRFYCPDGTVLDGAGMAPPVVRSLRPTQRGRVRRHPAVGPSRRRRRGRTHERPGPCQ